ncbi:SGNH/GDSL hydrolase family protein [Nostoc sp. FACHB-110]|uniref:SGNH/GDSL hydrolase family protein n=1 Tax=Nostoc sp. FACHB-110 TaxID=2692834 RepID=UPI001682CA52|nr:SGNH/GDSL hydrolase family protein [Nostoc sp. FACHB-110]MBD2438618.1 PEP-CTERM sorting domain-containing protein [Nostoc sp. FACHB-110]
MKKELAAGCVFLSFMLPSTAFAADFSKLYVFGDSLSDTGNIYKATNQAYPPSSNYDPTQPGPYNPSQPYYNGHFSNGPIWVEYLGNELGLKPTLYTDLTTTPPTQGINFAFGGASTGIDNAVFPNQGLPGVLSQVGLFTKPYLDNNQKLDPNALYTVWAGANDFLFLDDKDAATPVNNISQALGLLAQAGAKNILVFNLPNLGALPAAKNGRDPITLEQSTTAFNTGLATTIAALDKNYDLNIVSFDAYSLFDEVIHNPSIYGFNDVTNPCLTRLDVCQQDPSKFLFWDDVHPTTFAHKLIADKALQAIKAQEVPESSTTLGMLTLGALGLVAMRKRQQQKLHVTLKNRVLDAQSSRIKVES